MYRRAYLTGVITALTGYVGDDQTHSPSEENPSTERTRTNDGNGEEDSSENIIIRLFTSTSEEQSVIISIIENGNITKEIETSIGTDGPEYIDSGIKQKGNYESDVTVENGPKESSPFTVDEFALNPGLDIFTTVYDNEIKIAMEG